MARAVKKTLSEIGTLDPNKDKTPKAISAAEGIPSHLKFLYYQNLYKHRLKLVLAFLPKLLWVKLLV